MKKNIKSTSEQYRELAIQLRKECEDYLKEVVTAFGVVPLRECVCDMDCDGANAYVVYDGGNHPEYASNGCSDVIDVHLYKDGSVCVNIEDCEDYDIDRVAYTEDLEPLTDAVAAAVWCIADSLCSLVCPSWDDEKCSMAKEDFVKLQDIVLNDRLNEYFEGDDAEDYEDYCKTFNPKGCVSLLMKWANVEGDMVTFCDPAEDKEHKELTERYNDFVSRDNYERLDCFVEFAKEVLQPILDNEKMYDDSCYDFEGRIHDELRELVVRLGLEFKQKLAEK